MFQRITAKQLELFYGTSYGTAKKDYKTIQTCLNKVSPLTVADIAEYEKKPVELIQETFFPKKKAK